MGKDADRLWERLTGTKREPRITMATVRARWKKEAKSLPKEKRQAILDALWASRNVGDVAKKFELSVPLVCGLVDLNTYTVKQLRRETL